MAVSILKKPSEGQSKGMMPVYNGLPFIVDSNKKNRLNFKYIADVYVGGNLVTTLKHNKNISANNYGIFDVGRIVENFSKTRRYNFTTPGFAGDTTNGQNYYIKFGEEYERYLEYTQAQSYAGGSQTRLICDSSNVRVGDFIVLQNNTNPDYDFGFFGDIYWEVLNVFAGSIVIDKTWTSNSSGLIIEGEHFLDNYFYAHPILGQLVGFLIPNNIRPTRIEVGDTVVVSQRKAPVIPQTTGYDGEWLVVDIITVGLNKVIVTNCPWNTASSVVPGVIYAKDKYRFTEQITSTTEWTWNAGLQYKEFLNYNIDDFYISSAPSGQGRFLTNGPKTRKIREGQIEYLSLINWDNTIFFGMTAVYQSYTANGTLIDTHQVSLAPATKVWKVLQLGVGMENLESNLDFTNAAYYTVYLRDTASPSPNQISETITYLIDKECYRFTQKHIMWLNRLGGWDFYTFNLRSDKTINIDRNEYKRNLRSYNSTSGLYNYSMGDRGRTTYMVKAGEEETVFSNWIRDEELSWLEELYTSPEVYLIEDINNLLPINILDDSFTMGDKNNVGLKSYSITYKHSNDRVIQRG